MTIKQNLSEINAEKAKLEKELGELINGKICEFQRKYNIAVRSFYVSCYELPRVMSEETIPPFSYIESVEIELNETDYIMRNID